MLKWHPLKVVLLLYHKSLKTYKVKTQKTKYINPYHFLWRTTMLLCCCGCYGAINKLWTSGLRTYRLRWRRIILMGGPQERACWGGNNCRDMLRALHAICLLLIFDLRMIGNDEHIRSSFLVIWSNVLKSCLRSQCTEFIISTTQFSHQYYFFYYQCLLI